MKVPSIDEQTELISRMELKTEKDDTSKQGEGEGQESSDEDPVNGGGVDSDSDNK